MKHTYERDHKLGGWKVYEHSTYESGVNEGRERYRFVNHFDTEEEVQKVYPDATLESTHMARQFQRQSIMRSQPPADFDPTYAGEKW